MKAMGARLVQTGGFGRQPQKPQARSDPGARRRAVAPSANTRQSRENPAIAASLRRCSILTSNVPGRGIVTGRRDIYFLFSEAPMVRDTVTMEGHLIDS